MRTDSELQKDVIDEIKWEPCTTSSQIGVSASNGVVTLNGTVASNAEKWAVERAATRVQGVKGLAVEISVAITGPHAKSDTEIAEAAVNALSWHVWVPKEIIVSVSHGWVTLMGRANWEYQRNAAENSVRFMPGVKGVSNEIVLKTIAKPSEVKLAIEKALIRNAEIDSETIHVSIDCAAVTLTGRVRSWSERTQAAEAAWNAAGVNAVQNEISVVSI